MSRSRWIYVNGEAIPAEQFQREPQADFHIMSDLPPYKSMVDGSMIGGRRQHREHLSQHNLVEVGNETKHLKPYGQYKTAPGLKDTIIREVHQYQDAQRAGRKYGNH